MAIGHHVEYLKPQNFICWDIWRARHVTMSQFIKTIPSIVAILRFLNLATAAILDVGNRKSLMGLQRAKMHHRAEYRLYQSIRCRNIVIFRFFQVATSWIFEITKFYSLKVSRGLRRIIVPNFVKIIHCGNIADDSRRITIQNLSQSVNPL